ncbi:MAG: acetyl-CoA synthetase [Actinomycetota bacterium]|nr:acetyl-CoA synthetase [Actinomycetota bacterium]
MRASPRGWRPMSSDASRLYIAPVSQIAWRPSAALLEESNVARFAAAEGISDFAALRDRAIADPEWFWDAVVRFLGLVFSKPYSQVLDVSDGAPWARWFIGGRLNLASSCVDRWAGEPVVSDRPAVVWEGEEGTTRTLSWRELRSLTDEIAAGLAARGVKQGDAVGIFLPMLPETVAALLAVAKLGALFLPIFSGYAADAVSIRLADADAVALITADGFTRRAKVVSMKETADAAVESVPSVRTVVVVPRLGRDVPMKGGRDVTLAELRSEGVGTFEAVDVDSEHPLFVAYTSGTTGRPKGSVHVHGGFLAKVAEEAAFQTDLRRNERLFWLTDIGWIMGPWEIIGTLANGGTLVLYDGAPDFPGPDRLWALVERHRIGVLGVSPTLIRSLMAHGDDPVEAHDRSSLRILASTGEPWNEGPWRWFFEQVGDGRCPVINISGGTEVGACFLSPHVVEPLSPCSLGGPSLGMAVDVFDDAGHPVRGEVGELVCTKPWPGMTRGLWKDPQRYLDTYWSRYPGVWWHGDFASIAADGQWFLHGRSDDTIKLAGKRLGPAEVETVVVGHPSVVEAAAVGVPDAVKGEGVWVFVVVVPGVAATDELRAELASLVVEHLGPSFRPSAVRFTTALPKTRSAKVLRRAIRSVVTGAAPGDLSGLEDPETLDAVAHAT